MQSATSSAMRRTLALAQASRGPAPTATSSPAALLARRSFSRLAASTRPSSTTASSIRPIPSRRAVAPPIRHGSSSASSEPLAKTPLYDLHLAHGGKMVPFGGFHMPVQYEGLSVSKSHAFTREHSSIFDVSHMVQRLFQGPGAAAFLGRITPSAPDALPVHRSTLSTLLHADGSGGIVDDTIITRLPGNTFYVVTNAACRAKDDAYLAAELAKWNGDPAHASLQAAQDQLPDHGLIALQGPESEALLASLLADPAAVDLRSLYFGSSVYARVNLPSSGPSDPLLISRGGYTGEDGFEISIPGAAATVAVTEALLAAGGPERVQLAGLGARDSLRLEAGMCLYGHDLDDTTTPVEAGLSWIIPKERRGADAGYYGAEAIARQLVPRSKGGAGVARRRVGLVVEGAPAREGAEIASREGDKIGVVTSGCPSPTLGQNIAMGYVKDGMHKAGTEVDVLVRGRARKATVVKMPFVPAKYYKGT